MATNSPGDYYYNQMGPGNTAGQLGNIQFGPFGGLTAPNTGTWTTMTSTGPWTPTPPVIPDCDTISILPDGRILVQGSGWKVAIPKHLFSNILTIAEMGLLEKLVGEEKEDVK